MNLVLAHGFTQTARSWDHIAALLARQGLVSTVAVDLAGHGRAHDVETDLWGSAEHLVTCGGEGTYIGYSMGGRVCLHAALSHPETVERLVLIGATPGIVDVDERRSRRTSDEALADHIEDVGVETFVDEWLRLSLFTGLTAATDQRTDRLRNTAPGLASSLRLAGTGTQEPLWDRLGSIGVPVLLVVGEHDHKFRRVADQMAEQLPAASVAVVAGSGHSTHLEQPESTVDVITEWLGRSSRSGGLIRT